MRAGAMGIIDVLLGALGVGMFVYGDLVPSRNLRIAGFVVVTVCIVIAAIRAAFRDDS